MASTRARSAGGKYRSTYSLPTASPSRASVVSAQCSARGLPFAGDSLDEGPRQVRRRRLEELEAEVGAPDGDRRLAQRPVELAEQPRLGDVDARVAARQPGLVEVRGPVDGRRELDELGKRRRVIGLRPVAGRRGVERALGELRLERDHFVGAPRRRRPRAPGAPRRACGRRRAPRRRAARRSSRRRCSGRSATDRDRRRRRRP